MTAEIEKSEAEWKAQLTPEQYRVLRRKGTERPFSGGLLHVTADGSYTCAGCGAVLFSSGTKFDSGTGWPSFTDPRGAKRYCINSLALAFDPESGHGSGMRPGLAT